jgi:hypothetical protein
MNNFTFEAFATGCNAAMTGGQSREHTARQLFQSYCEYLKQQTRSNQHG